MNFAGFYIEQIRKGSVDTNAVSYLISDINSIDPKFTWTDLRNAMEEGIHIENEFYRRQIGIPVRDRATYLSPMDVIRRNTKALNAIKTGKPFKFERIYVDIDKEV